MYCRITFVQLKRGVSEEAQVIFQGSLIPAALRQKGLGGIYWLQSMENPTEKGIGASACPIVYWR